MDNPKNPRRSGSLWNRSGQIGILRLAGSRDSHRTCGRAIPTPVCDGPHVWEAPPHTCVRRSRYIEWTLQTVHLVSGPGLAIQSGSDPDLCVLTVRRPTRSPQYANGPSSSTGRSTRLAISAVKERAFREQASKTHTQTAIRVCDPGDLPGPDDDQQKESAAHSQHRCLPVLPSRYTPLLDRSAYPSLSPVRESDSVRLGPGN